MRLFLAFGPEFGRRAVVPARRSRRLAVEALNERINPSCGCTPLPPSQISGLVYFDQNKDGFAQDTEPRLQGVVVTLSGKSQDGDAVSMQATTDAGGIYMFQGLEAGTYKIKATAPNGYTPGGSSVGAFGGTTGGNVITGIAIPQGQSSGAYNFGEIQRPPRSHDCDDDDHDCGRHRGCDRDDHDDNGHDKDRGPKGNNGIGNGFDPQPRGNPPVNDGPGTYPGGPGNRGGAKK